MRAALVVVLAVAVVGCGRSDSDAQTRRAVLEVVDTVVHHNDGSPPDPLVPTATSQRVCAAFTEDALAVFTDALPTAVGLYRRTFWFGLAKLEHAAPVCEYGYVAATQFFGAADAGLRILAGEGDRPARLVSLDGDVATVGFAHTDRTVTVRRIDGDWLVDDLTFAGVLEGRDVPPYAVTAARECARAARAEAGLTEDGAGPTTLALKAAGDLRGVREREARALLAIDVPSSRAAALRAAVAALRDVPLELRALLPDAVARRFAAVGLEYCP